MVRVDGSKVRLFATRAEASKGARDIGWPVGCVTRVCTRFCIAWALGTGIDLDPVTGLPCVSRERYGELFRARVATDRSGNTLVPCSACGKVAAFIACGTCDACWDNANEERP